MVTVEDIKSLKEHYNTHLYANVRNEQTLDNQYIMDTFDVPEIHEPHQIYRSGIGDRVVNAPAEHIITSEPQVFFYPKSPTKTAQESALRLSKLVNEEWIPLLQQESPNIFKEFIKNLLGRGEGFFKVVHNTDWLNGHREGLPVNFIVPDPMVVYSSPDERNAVPEKVILFYSISQYQELIPKYPFLAERKSDQGKTITWLEYYDEKTRYVELDEHAITKGGIQPNLYGFTPFVRKYSGFGRRSPDGELASLIVSDIKRSRDLIREECAIRSNIASVEYLFAHRSRTYIGEGLTPDMIKDSVSYGAYDINVIDADPAQLKIDTLDIKPAAETYKHHADILAQLNQRHPFIMSGFPWGTSGRQQDITELSAMRRYDSVVENTEYAFATALGMALKICAIIPGLKPEGVTQKDLQNEFTIQVRLKAKDPVENDRKITLGERLWNGGKGSISLSTLHTQYQGMTQEESKREIAQILADQITIYNPDVASVMGMVFAEESGLEDWLEKAQARRQQMEQQQGLRKPLSKTGEERIRGEVETEFGEEEAVRRGARESPSRYTRQGG